MDPELIKISVAGAEVLSACTKATSESDGKTAADPRESNQEPGKSAPEKNS